VSYFQDLLRRLRLSWRWILAQFVCIPLLVLVGLAWTRLPEKHIWQVLLSLLLPLLLLAGALVLQAGTMRQLAKGERRRVGLTLGTASLLGWVALAWVSWAILDWCDDQIPQWASYLNSRAPAHMRAALFSFEHIQRWLTGIEWVLRWIVVPAKILPYAMASSWSAWWMPWRRALRILWNWRWWPAWVLAAPIGIWLPGHLFDSLPSGSVQAQVWRVGLKITVSYLLGVGCWVLLLGWLAVLFGRQQQPPAEEALVPAHVLTGPEDKAASAKADLPPDQAPQS
jgi:hypothetical protein